MPTEPAGTLSAPPGRAPLNTERVRRLVQAQALLAAGRSYNEARKEAGSDSTVVRDVFDNTGRVRLTARAEALLNWKEPELVAGLRELPRALAGEDALILANVLRRNAAQALPDLRQAAADAGMQAAALDHLFDPQGWLRADRINALPDDQQQMFRGALIPVRPAGTASGSQAANPPPPPLPAVANVRVSPAQVQRAAMLVQAQARIAAGESLEAVAPGAGVSLPWLSRVIDRGGHLLLGPESARFLNAVGAAQAEQIAAMPRALRYMDLHKLKRVLTEHAGTPQADLRAAFAAEGLGPEPLAYLLDGEGRIRRDRVATLPPDQQQTLIPGEAVVPAATGAAAAEGATAQGSAAQAGDAAQASAEAQAGAAARLAGASIAIRRATLVAEAQAMLAAGQPRERAAAHANIHINTLGQSLDLKGRLLFTSHAERYLGSADAELAARFAAMPRALRPTDVVTLQRLLIRHAAEPNADLQQAGVTAGMTPQALAYLLDADGRLRADRVATLPDDQRLIVQSAMPGGTAASAGPSAAATEQAGPSAPADPPVTVVSPQADAMSPPVIVLSPPPDTMPPPADAMLPPAAVAVRKATAAEEAAIQRAEAFAQAQALLAQNMPRQQVAQQAHISTFLISTVFNARGRLLFTPQAERLMDCADPALAARFAAMPRAIRDGEMRHLERLLTQHRIAPLPDLREACAAAGIGPAALAYVFDGDGQLRADGFAGLPRDQREALHKALGREGAAPGPVTPPEPSAAPDAQASSSRPAPAPDPQPSTWRPPRPRPRPSTSRPASGSGASTSRPAPRLGPSTSRPVPSALSGTIARPTQGTALRPGAASQSVGAGPVLQFFRQHRHPEQAFDEARTRFNLTRAGLLNLLASVGVTELEAHGGRLPDATTLWQRIRGGAAAFSGAPSVPLGPATSVAVTAATSAAAATPSADLADFAASLEGMLPLATPTPATTPSSHEFAASLEAMLQSAAPTPAATPSSQQFAASLEDMLQSAASTPAATPSSSEFAASLEAMLQSAAATPAATPSLLGKRPEPEPTTSPEALRWGTQAARTQRPRPAGQAAVAVPPPLPEAVASPEPADLDNLDVGLLDPGTPDWGFLDSTAPWLMTSAGQRPPSSSAAQPAASAAASTSQVPGDWLDGLDWLDAMGGMDETDTPWPLPDSPPGPNPNPP
jgi:hypothetical protein